MSVRALLLPLQFPKMALLLKRSGTKKDGGSRPAWVSWFHIPEISRRSRNLTDFPDNGKEPDGTD